MFQRHPLDTCGKLLRRFYEPLVLLHVLDPTRGAQRPDLTSDRGLDDWSKLWRNFLDQLSMLCDARKGGDTVTAIAVQSTPECPVYWVASNSKPRTDTQELLLWVLARLATAHSLDSSAEKRVQDEIEARCIGFSASRVKTYTRSLLKCVNRARQYIQGSTSPDDKVVLLELSRIENLAETPQQLCALAYALRRHEMMNVLHSRHIVHEQRGIWSDLRHYIGRLGSWSKAARVLVMGAKRFPQHIENAQISIIEPSGPADLPNAEHVTDVASAVRRMLPANQDSLAAELTQALEGLDAVTGIQEKFPTKYADIKPRPHAELLVLEHFHHQKLHFVANDRYIGCSKPSCYCCHLYMRCHPGDFTPRPCHGNLWPNWAPPIPLPLCEHNRKLQKGESRVQAHHTFRMLQAMVAHIRQDLQSQIQSRQPRRQKLPDSTTGMSSVLFGVDKAFQSTTFDPILEDHPEGRNEQADELAGSETWLGVPESLDTGSDESDPLSDTNFTHADEVPVHALTKETSIIKEEVSRSQSRDINLRIKDLGARESTQDSDTHSDEEDTGYLLFKGRNRSRNTTLES